MIIRFFIFTGCLEKQFGTHQTVAGSLIKTASHNLTILWVHLNFYFWVELTQNLPIYPLVYLIPPNFDMNFLAKILKSGKLFCGTPGMFASKFWSTKVLFKKMYEVSHKKIYHFSEFLQEN